MHRRSPMRLAGWPWIGLFVMIAFARPEHARAQAEPWTEPLRAARAAYMASRFEQAAPLFEAAYGAIGEPVMDAVTGNTDYTPAQAEARATIACLWGLSVLAAPTDPDGDDRDVAIMRVRFGCGPLESAVAADLLGDPLQAALHLNGRAFPAPFASRVVSPEARAFARGRSGELIPPARNLDEALRYVRAIANADHGIDTTCGDPFGFDWVALGPRAVVAYEIEWMERMGEDEEPPPLPLSPLPFGGSATDLAMVRCFSPPRIAPEDAGFGDGATSTEYLLRREPDGHILVVGSFPGFPLLDCLTGVVMQDIAAYSIRLADGSPLYAFVRREGYIGWSEEDPSFVVDQTILCDPARRSCRSLPTGISRTELVDTDEDLEPRHTEWHARLLVSARGLRLSTVRGAPTVMLPFRRAVPLETFFGSPSIDTREWVLYGETPPAATRECPWEVMDPDGHTNVRPSPSSSGEPLGTVPTGTIVAPVERRGRWYRIEAPVAGWVWAPNLRQACP